MAVPPKFAASRTRDIVQSGEDIRARVRAMTLMALDGSLDLATVKNVATEVMHATAETVKNAVPEKQSSALRGVFDGLSDAMDEAAKSTAAMIKDAQARGKTLKDKDLAKAANSLKEIEEHFFTTVSGAAGKFGSATKAELGSLVEGARKAGTSIRPHVTEAFKSADGRLMELAGEAAGAGAKVARAAAAATLGAASGLLQGLSERVAKGKKPAKTAKKAAKKPAAKPKAAKAKPKAKAKGKKK